MDANLVILAAGASSRMKKESREISDPAILKETRSMPKCMIRVGADNRPFLDYLLANAGAAGYRRIVIVVAENDPSIPEYYRARPFAALSLAFVPQKIPAGAHKPAGTAHALLQAFLATPEWSGAKSTVCNADNLYSVNALRLLLQDPHENAMIDYDRSALQFSQERVMQFAIVCTNAEGYLTDILEKPSADEASGVMNAKGRIGVSMNLWRFSYDRVLPILGSTPLHPARKEKELPLAVRELIRQRPNSVFALPLSEHVPDLTSPADVPIVRAYLEAAPK